MFTLKVNLINKKINILIITNKKIIFPYLSFFIFAQIF